MDKYYGSLCDQKQMCEKWEAGLSDGKPIIQSLLKAERCGAAASRSTLESPRVGDEHVMIVIIIKCNSFICELQQEVHPWLQRGDNLLLLLIYTKMF